MKDRPLGSLHGTWGLAPHGPQRHEALELWAHLSSPKKKNSEKREHVVKEEQSLIGFQGITHPLTKALS